MITDDPQEMETKLIQYSKDACEALEVLGKVCVDVYLRSSTEEISSEKLRPVKLRDLPEAA